MNSSNAKPSKSICVEFTEIFNIILMNFIISPTGIRLFLLDNNNQFDRDYLEAIIKNTLFFEYF